MIARIHQSYFTYLIRLFFLTNLSVNRELRLTSFRLTSKTILYYFVHIKKLSPLKTYCKFRGHLTWKTLLCKVYKLATRIGILNHIQYSRPQLILFNLYYSLIYPCLSYSNLIWAANNPSRLALRIAAKQC